MPRIFNPCWFCTFVPFHAVCSLYLGLWISIRIHSRTLCFTCPRSMLQVLHRAMVWNNFWMFIFCHSAVFLWDILSLIVSFIYSEKAIRFCEISTVLLTGTTLDKSTVVILQNIVVFSEYMNFNFVKWIFTPKQFQPTVCT